MLASGRRVLDRLFPGISNELIDGGAVVSDIVNDFRWFHEGACLARFSSDLMGLLMSLLFLEHTVRNRVLSLPKLRSVQNCDVEGLITNRDKSQVIGVQVGGEAVVADLVVDASGRGSHSPQWLDQMGYDKPVENRVEIALAYTTRMFRRRPTDRKQELGVVIPPTPHGKRGGVMLAQEGERWTVTLVSHFGTSAPPELPEFIEYSHTRLQIKE